jgi:hypothetical protein
MVRKRTLLANTSLRGQISCFGWPCFRRCFGTKINAIPVAWEEGMLWLLVCWPCKQPGAMTAQQVLRPISQLPDHFPSWSLLPHHPYCFSRINRSEIVVFVSNRFCKLLVCLLLLSEHVYLVVPAVCKTVAQRSSRIVRRPGPEPCRMLVSESYRCLALAQGVPAPVRCSRIQERPANRFLLFLQSLKLLCAVSRSGEALLLLL